MNDTTGPRLVELLVPRDGDGHGGDVWNDAGFAVTDGRVRVGALDLVVAGPDAASTNAAELRFTSPHPDGRGDLGGIAWRAARGLTGTALAAPTPHPNGVSGIDHVVILAPTADAVRAELGAAGFVIRRERPATVMGNEALQLFAWAGDILLEIVAPTGTAEAPHARDWTIWGVALTAPDLDATAAWFGDATSEPRAAVQAGRRICSLRRRALGLPLEVAIMSER